jgi:hypothetical protein
MAGSFEVWMQDEKTGEPTEEHLLAHAFKPIFEFILRGKQGDTAAAKRPFSAISRRRVAGGIALLIASLRRAEPRRSENSTA